MEQQYNANKNELQELYKLKGKISAIEAYAKAEKYPSSDIILSILGINVNKKGE